MTTLYWLEQFRGRFVMQVDSDCLISRPDKEYDYLGRPLGSFRSHPGLVTISFSMGQKWRTELRCGLVEMDRLKGPLPSDRLHHNRGSTAPLAIQNVGINLLSTSGHHRFGRSRLPRSRTKNGTVRKHDMIPI
jgi:hypothetical protein